MGWGGVLLCRHHSALSTLQPLHTALFLHSACFGFTHTQQRISLKRSLKLINSGSVPKNKVRHGKSEQNWKEQNQIVTTKPSLRHREQTSEESQRGNYISMVKMGGEHQRKMGGKLCKLSLTQAKKKNPSLFFPFWSAIKKIILQLLILRWLRFFFSFLELEKWFETSSCRVLPSLENSDHTTKSTDTWMNWTACQCYRGKKRREFINCTTEYEFIYPEKMRILLNESSMKRKRLCSGTSSQYLNNQVLRLSFFNIKRK